MYCCGAASLAAFLCPQDFPFVLIIRGALQEELLPFNTMAKNCIFLIFCLLVNPSSLLPALPVGLITAAVWTQAPSLP